jgi:hypothetical protein
MYVSTINHGSSIVIGISNHNIVLVDMILGRGIIIACTGCCCRRGKPFHSAATGTSFWNQPLLETSKSFLLAHMNYARLKAPMDDPIMDEFRMAMDPVNALAKATPGFVWSLDASTPEQRDAVQILKDDPLLMPQLSLWEDLESLQHFAFKSGHAMYLKRKREWFTAPCDGPFAVCWWKKAVVVNNNDESEFEYPTLKEAFERLELLQTKGPTPDAFDFKTAKLYSIPTTKS